MMKKHIIFLLVLALILSEICLIINNTAGFVLYLSLIALGLLSLSHVEILNDYGKLVIVLMILPIVRVIGLFITLGFFWKVLISYLVLIFLAFYYSGRFRLDHGHKKEKLGWLPFSIFAGVLLGIIGNSFFSFDKYSWLIYIIPVISYSEEILFRGMIQNLLEKSAGVSLAVLITSVLYAVFSLGYGVSFALFIFPVGMIIGLIYSHTKNIFLAAAVNILVHYFIFALPQI